MNSKLYGLIGYPLGHSFSVPFFEKKFKAEGIDAEYRNFPLEEINEFETLLKVEPDLSGLNVTVPYKQLIIPYLDALSKTARAIQAVNTVLFCRRDGRLALIGHNTDVGGFRKSLEEHLKKQHRSALVLGSGGSSKAVIHVLETLEIEFKLISRSRGEDRLSYEQVDADLVAQTPLLINTTPLGMFPDVESSPAIPYEAIHKDHLLFDLVYNPERTQFLKKGEERGAAVVNGYDMLVYQAEASWEIWNKES